MAAEIPSVYVVVAGVEYEGSTPVRAFLSESQAKAFQGHCYAYLRNQPLYEDTGDDAVFEEACQRHSEWRKNHPAGQENASSDYFSVLEIPLEKIWCLANSPLGRGIGSRNDRSMSVLHATQRSPRPPKDSV